MAVRPCLDQRPAPAAPASVWARVVGWRGRIGSPARGADAHTAEEGARRGAARRGARFSLSFAAAVGERGRQARVQTAAASRALPESWAGRGLSPRHVCAPASQPGEPARSVAIPYPRGFRPGRTLTEAEARSKVRALFAALITETLQGDRPHRIFVTARFLTTDTGRLAFSLRGSVNF